MELNSLNSTQFSNIDQLNLNQLQNVDKSELDSISQPSKIDKIEIESQNQSSSFANNLISNINEISNLSSVTSVVSKQLEIVNKIEQSISSTISNSSSQTLDDIQPNIKNLMDNFNTLSNSNSISLNSDIEEEKSRVYFDGILGAKPLSSEEIFAEVSSQRERLETINKVANDQVLNKIEQSKELFTTQKQELETQQPNIKEYDFSQESNSFEPQVIQKLQGSIVDTQANAKTEQNLKLLATA